MAIAQSSRPKERSRRLWTYSEMVANFPETNQPVEQSKECRELGGEIIRDLGYQRDFK
jgi:hypothetical protein